MQNEVRHNHSAFSIHHFAFGRESAKRSFTKGDVMLTYELKKAPGVPLYEALYRAIRGDILSGRLQPGENDGTDGAGSGNLR
jgi:hypothetical protein